VIRSATVTGYYRTHAHRPHRSVPSVRSRGARTREPAHATPTAAGTALKNRALADPSPTASFVFVHLPLRRRCALRPRSNCRQEESGISLLLALFVSPVALTLSNARSFSFSSFCSLSLFLSGARARARMIRRLAFGDSDEPSRVITCIFANHTARQRRRRLSQSPFIILSWVT